MFSKDKGGFMPGLYLAFLEEMSPEDKTHFGELTSQAARAQAVLNHPFISEKFDNIQFIDKKDNHKSSKAREEGNALFQSGNVPASLVKYSSAVAFASCQGSELSLALANRSAALQRLRIHDKGVMDIDAALEAGYPVDKQFKLYERRGQLMLELKQFEKARDCFSQAIKLVQMSSLIQTKKEKFSKDMQSLISKLKGKSDCAQQTLDTGNTLQQMLTEVEPHCKYKSLHRSVEVTVTRDQGRFTVAAEDIPAGTTLLVEEPLGWALEVEKFSSHCQHCLGVVTVTVPCSGCTTVMFCSQECRQAAMALYHQKECGMMG